jgi:cbb3-type cytochrome oxidase maturation protein
VLLLGRGGGVLGVALAMLALASPAFAHDNLGGDELAMAFWMFSFSVAIALTGGFCLWWAARTGQFRNIEEAKYRMLEDAPDLDDLPAPEPRPQATRPAPAPRPAEHKV